MYTKKELLSEFYTTMDQKRVKVETKSHGFEYLKGLNSIATLDYSEWKNGVFKYKLTELHPDTFNNLLQEHLDSKINLCVYFSEVSNNIFCFNLDTFSKNYNGLKAVARFLDGNLKRMRIEPLILKSGHGYHFWCRLSSAVENRKLQTFMKSMMDIVVFQAVADGISISKLQCIRYPRYNSHDISIRLFGSTHTVTGRFNFVVTKIDNEDELLDEENSWRYFESYIKDHTIDTGLFEQAFKFAIRLASIVK